MKAMVGMLAVMSAGILAGCQSYDFEPVEPRALTQARNEASVAGRKPPPNMMLVVDKSGSMNAPADSSDPDCPQNCRNLTALCPDNCATRWTELQDAMSNFLSDRGTVARMGLVTYPTNAVCSAPTNLRVELPTSDEPAALQASANQIRGILQDIKMGDPRSSTVGDDLHTGGGTPTGNTLASLRNYAVLADDARDNFALLLTDGLPNCNPNHPADGEGTPDQIQACACQAENCNGNNRKLGCLDSAGTIQQINELQALGIRTIVVGFGIDATVQHAPQTLQAMAQAGGFVRKCPNGTDAECGAGNTCNKQTLQCNNQYFSAKNGKELAEALDEIQRSIVPLCEYELDVVPQDNNPEFIAVRVDGETVPAGTNTWKYSTEEGRTRVIIQGALCSRLEASTAADPVELEIRVIQSL